MRRCTRAAFGAIDPTLDMSHSRQCTATSLITAGRRPQQRLAAILSLLRETLCRLNAAFASVQTERRCGVFPFVRSDCVC